MLSRAMQLTRALAIVVCGALSLVTHVVYVQHWRTWMYVLVGFLVIAGGSAWWKYTERPRWKSWLPGRRRVSTRWPHGASLEAVLACLAAGLLLFGSMMAGAVGGVSGLERAPRGCAFDDRGVPTRAVGVRECRHIQMNELRMACLVCGGALAITTILVGNGVPRRPRGYLSAARDSS